MKLSVHFFIKYLNRDGHYFNYSKVNEHWYYISDNESYTLTQAESEKLLHTEEEALAQPYILLLKKKNLLTDNSLPSLCGPGQSQNALDTSSKSCLLAKEQSIYGSGSDMDDNRNRCDDSARHFKETY